MVRIIQEQVMQKDMSVLVSFQGEIDDICALVGESEEASEKLSLCVLILEVR
jgi:hypothetical protein